MRRISYLIALIMSLYILSFSVQSAEFVDMGIPENSETEYEGYIVTLKNPEDIQQPDGALFGEGMLFSEMTQQDFYEFIDENVDNTSAVIPEINMMKVDDEETLQQLKDAGLVQSYEPDYKMYLLGYDYTENPHFSSQWGHGYINSQYAWNAGVFGKDVRVAVIDSGVYPHKDLVNNLAEGYNYVDNNTNTTDSLGHGTFVAGIIASQCNNLATVGLAHRATIVPLKVTDAGTFAMSNAIKAMKDAVDLYDCDVINMSLGTTVSSSELQSALSYVIGRDGGAILVAAAGNGHNNDYECYIYPAAYDSAISVANAQVSGDTLVIKSTSTHNDKVDIAAPGTSVYSLDNSESGVASGSGTSFACPYVAAAAALVKSVMPSINQAQFNVALQYSANTKYITETQGKNYWGNGLLDVKALVEFVLKVQYGDFYLSAADEQEYGDNTSVYLTNLTSGTKKFGNVVIYNYITNETGMSRLNAIKFVPAVLNSGESMEISFNDLGMFGEVKYSMLSDNLKPLINPVREVTVNE